MTPERWKQIEQIFNTAADLKADELTVYLKEACGEDQELRREVEALLTKATGRDTLFTTAIGAAADALSSTYQSVFTEGRIGSYRITGLIGRGGMAEVFSAVRDDDMYEKRVAIKLIRRGLASEFMVQRFLNERQILASLDHPNIARLLDGGVTQEGLPYFIMEYIEGVPIDRYCEEHGLLIRQRIELIRHVCSAVACAHRSLIIHRDLKPGNILVTRDGQPKLLDFGIAKLLDEGRAHEGPVTVTGIRLMTPHYASPEQILGERITTASDIYSLGVVMYELLTGKRPSRPQNQAVPFIEPAALDFEPRKPSSVVSLARGKRARRELAGDLDNIVLMAMRREPERRYQSADQLSEDLRRYLSRRPVRARPDTLVYRTGKFVRRHKAAVSLGVVVLILLIAVAVTTTLQATRISRERDRATQVTEFLVRLFEVSRPSEARGSQVKAREVLDEGARRIEQELKGQPDVQASMMDTIGRVYHNLGLHDQARSLIEQALDIRRGIFGDRHPEVATSLEHLALVLKDTGDYDQAESMLLTSLQIRRDKLGRENAEVASSLHNLAGVLQAKGNYEGAEPLFRQSLQIRRRLFGDRHPQVATSLNSLAYLLKVKGEFDAAEALYREALEMRRSLLGNEHPDVATSLNNLARLLSDKGDNEAAIPLMREAVALDRKLLGDQHPDLATSMNNLGVLLRADGEYEEAETLLRSALDIRRRSLGNQHPSVATSIYSLGMVMLDKGDADQAEGLFREALALWRGALPPQHPNISHALLGLGRVLIEKGDPRKAEPLLREALEIRMRSLPAGHVQIGTVKAALGDCLMSLNRYQEAEKELVDSYRAFEGKSDDRRKAIGRLIRLYESWNKPDEAAKYKSELGSGSGG